jgi:hypothetical protein
MDVHGALRARARVPIVVPAQTAHTPYLEVANIDSASYRAWARELVSTGWWPTRNFYQSPFYAYFLGGLYAIFGDGPWPPLLAQVVLGSLTPVFTYAIATRLFTRRAGLVAGLLICLYGPLVLEEVTLNKTSLLIVTCRSRASPPTCATVRAARPGASWSPDCSSASPSLGSQWLLASQRSAIYSPPSGSRPHARGASEESHSRASWAPACSLVAPVVAWNSALGRGLVPRPAVAPG